MADSSKLIGYEALRYLYESIKAGWRLFSRCLKCSYTDLLSQNGRGENRTLIPSREVDFESTASTSFATRPWVKLYHHTPFLRFATTIDILYCSPSDRFVAPAGRGQGELVRWSAPA